MRKGIVVFLVLGVLVGCYRTWIEVTEEVQAPNWTSDNKVIFLLERIEWYHEEAPPVFSGYVEPRRATLILMQCNADGSGMESLGVVYDVPEKDYYSFGLSLSSAQDWVVVGIPLEIDEITGECFKGGIWVIRRDGTGLQKVGSGINPDFSPDASQIVYEKPDSGIWVMDRDGSNNHCIVPDPDAKHPAWSPDNNLIAYLSGYSTYIITLTGDSIGCYPKTYFYDWGGIGTGEIFVGLHSGGYARINIYSGKLDSVSMCIVHVSIDGNYYIGEDAQGYFVCKKDGTNKWHLKDIIEGGEK